MASEKFYLTVDCNNDAFWPNPQEEIARILDRAARKLDMLEPNDRPIPLMDAKGNRVGAMWVTSE